MTSSPRPSRLRDGENGQNQLASILCADALKEPTEMGPNGRVTEAELRGNLLVAISAQDQRDDLGLLRRQVERRGHF